MKSNDLKMYTSIILFFILILLIGMAIIKEDKKVPDEKNKQVNNDIEYKVSTNGKIESVNKNVNLEFELPITGASGYASIEMNLKETNSLDSKTIETVNRGEAFTIILEKDDWWYIDYNDVKGWVENTFCMINLPDIIPSIVYDDTNSYKSMFRSSGYELPDITGERLYDVSMYNSRLGKTEFVMPVLYHMAKNIYEAQQLALKNGDSLKIYETYRPYEVQMKIADTLNALAAINGDVNNGINTDGWSKEWFISNNLSNHQLGVAIDTSLVKVNTYKIKTMGKYKYIRITKYAEYEMPTNIHELSAKTAVFKYGVATDSKTAWKSAPFSSTITEGAKRLQNYCTSADLTPLASEWWHFNDLDAKEIVKGNKSNGQYYLSGCASIKVIE
jgi:D-alanyl-D-alanine dipeptidase